MKTFAFIFLGIAFLCLIAAVVFNAWWLLIIATLSLVCSLVCFQSYQHELAQNTTPPPVQMFRKGDKVMLYDIYGKLCQGTVSNPYDKVRVEYTDSQGKFVSRPANPSSLRPCQ